MSSSPVTVLVTMTPNKDKVSRCVELQARLTESVKAQETGTLSYEYYMTDAPKEEGTGLTNIFIIMKCKYKSYIAERKELKHHRDIGIIIEEEKLFRRPLEYKIIRELGGFRR